MEARQTDNFVRSNSQRWVFRMLLHYNRLLKEVHQNSWHQVWQELSLLFKFTLHKADIRVTILVLRYTKWGTLNTHRSKQKLVTQYVERSGPRHSSFETGQVSLIIKKMYLLLYLYALTDSQYTKSIQKCIHGSRKYGLGLRKGVF